jgi:Putative serine esterase (DUF676)
MRRSSRIPRNVRILAFIIPVVLVILIGTLVYFNVNRARAASYISSTRWPVVFIHGFNNGSALDCNSTWQTAINYLRGTHNVNGQASHWTGALTTLGYYNGDTNCNANATTERSHCSGYNDSNSGTKNEDIRHIACETAWYLYLNYSRSGKNVQVVAHSMGGLIIRYALHGVQAHITPFPPTLYVQDVVTFDTPHGGIPNGTPLFYCGNCLEFQQMQVGSSFMNDLSSHAQNPQGSGWGTDWTMMGSWGTILGVFCDIVAFQQHTAIDMDSGHKSAFYSPCYTHGGFLTDTSDSLDTTIDFCDKCAISPSAWTRSTSAPHALLRMFNALYSSSW